MTDPGEVLPEPDGTTGPELRPGDVWGDPLPDSLSFQLVRIWRVENRGTRVVVVWVGTDKPVEGFTRRAFLDRFVRLAARDEPDLDAWRDYLSEV